MKRKTTLFPALLLAATQALGATLEPAAGGGWGPSLARDHLSFEQRTRIVRKIRDNRALLQEQGLLPDRLTVDGGPPAHPLFDWPTAATIADPGYFGISNFVDHDPAFPDLLEDYSCGTRTYDTEDGYNHRGLDVFSWPFSWLKMDNDEVEVVAAEPGVIVGKDDGNFDRNCSFVGDWNAVYIEHADGSVAWYGHLKENSLTTKSLGEAVAAGEFLGVMGSSGQSTGPHLHFEVYDAEDALIDPSQGACNSLNAEGWWVSQRPYYEPGINLVATHSAEPVLDNGCGVAETPNLEQYFEPGELGWFAVYLRDQQAGQPLALAIYQPDGSVWQSWDFTLNSPAHYAASWWIWNFYLPSQPQAGPWKWQVHFQGQQAESLFFVGDTTFLDSFED